MKTAKIILSRSAYCDRCNKAGRPDEESKILLWGNTRKKFFWIEGDSVPKRNRGMTPHLILVYDDIPSAKLDKIVYKDCELVCGVLGCSVFIEDDKEGKPSVVFRNTKTKVF